MGRCEEDPQTSFQKYIDGEPDDKMLFEGHTYFKRHKSAPVALGCMAKVRSCITWILVVAPVARVDKLALKRCIRAAIDARPYRAIMPSVPKTELIRKLAVQVAHAFCLEIILGSR